MDDLNPNIDLYGEDIIYEQFTLDYYETLIKELSLKNINTSNVFSDEEWTNIYNVLTRVFDEYNITTDESDESVNSIEQFDMLKSTKGYLFTTLYSFIKAHVYGYDSSGYIFLTHLFVIGMYLSAKVINSASNNKQKYVIRSMCLNWYKIRITEEYQIWDESSSWTQIMKRTDFIKNINSSSIQIMNKLRSVDGDLFDGIVKCVDEIYSIKFISSKIVIPAILDGVYISEDMVFVRDGADGLVNIDDPRELFDIRNAYNKTIPQRRESMFTIDMMRDNIYREESNIDMCIFMVDRRNSQAYNPKIISALSVSDPTGASFNILVKKDNGVKIRCDKNFPGIINPRISSVIFDIGNHTNEEAAWDYIRSTFVTEREIDTFLMFCVHCLINSNYKKILYVFGRNGDEGKSYFTSLITGVFGSVKVLPENVIFGTNKADASTHTEHYRDIEKCGFISVPDAKNRPVNESVSKQISSNDDAIFYRAIMSASRQIYITAPMKIDSNHLLRTYPGSSIALYNRFYFLEMKVKFIHRTAYKTKISAICTDCARRYRDPTAQIIRCTHKYTKYIETISNGKRKYYNLIEPRDKNKIQRGLLSIVYKLAYDEINNRDKETKSYIRDPTFIVDAQEQYIYRLEVFFKTYHIFDIISSYSENSINIFLRDKDTFFDSLQTSEIFEKISERIAIKTDYRKSYLECLSVFKNCYDTDDYWDKIKHLVRTNIGF